jgi:hypothetical protein
VDNYAKILATLSGNNADGIAENASLAGSRLAGESYQPKY